MVALRVIALTNEPLAVAGRALMTESITAVPFSTRDFSSNVRAGVLDNAPLTADQVAVLADLPSKDALRAKLLGLLQTPASQFVRVLNEPGASLARVLKAKADSLQ